mmetsp:Transcript_26798/g.73734  ORF Transcript_26798/g.73734 Transcript_26798/m.73734 type:complete len:139 (+) Transcript_26798:493-909(+)
MDACMYVWMNLRQCRKAYMPQTTTTTTTTNMPKGMQSTTQRSNVESSRASNRSCSLRQGNHYRRTLRSCVTVSTLSVLLSLSSSPSNVVSTLQTTRRSLVATLDADRSSDNDDGDGGGNHWTKIELEFSVTSIKTTEV